MRVAAGEILNNFYYETDSHTIVESTLTAPVWLETREVLNERGRKII